jgi:L-ascorbate metabolism protein UlaG (beta-lactamase superfamily)
MIIQKLNWAGLKLECGDKTILIDAAENFSAYHKILGNPLTPLFRFSDTVKADYILLTHLHLDHFDKDVIHKCLKPEGKIIGFKPHENAFAKLNHDFISLGNDEVYVDGDIKMKAVFSSDGIGEEQTAWIVWDANTKIFHGGDTIWHNQFWKLGKENKDIDFAFLPINGAIVNFQMAGIEYSSVPASMTPEQAFNAAKLLHAKTLVPIHYGMFSTPLYKPNDTSDFVLNQLSVTLNQPYKLLDDGHYLN